MLCPASVFFDRIEMVDLIDVEQEEAGATCGDQNHFYHNQVYFEC